MGAMAFSFAPRRPRIFLALFFLIVVALIFVASSRADVETLRSWHIPSFTTDNDIVADEGPKVVPDVKTDGDVQPHEDVAADKEIEIVAESDIVAETDSGTNEDATTVGNTKGDEDAKPDDDTHAQDDASADKDAAADEDTPAGDDDSLNQDPVQISIIESDGVHDEVSAALITAFGGHSDAEMKLWFANQRYGMQDITNKFDLRTPIVSRNGSKDFHAAVDKEAHPDIVVLTTCEHDTLHMPAAIHNLLTNGTAHLFCTVHHADQWGKGRNVDVIREWAEKGKLDFITLSQHTADFLRNRTVAKWNEDFNVKIPIHVLPPVFNVELPAYNTTQGISLAMQGDYSSARRDYKGIFNHLSGIIEVVRKASSEASSVALRLIGHGSKPTVPDNVKEFVHFDSSLSYTQFYTLLSQAFSILPAFASNEYYDRKASSTVPASLIAGSPLVANDELLRAYTYYPREAAWVAEEGESEMDVIKRVVNQKDEFMRKRELIKEAREKLIEDNQSNAQKWVDKLMKE